MTELEIGLELEIEIEEVNGVVMTTFSICELEVISLVNEELEESGLVVVEITTLLPLGRVSGGGDEKVAEELELVEMVVIVGLDVEINDEEKLEEAEPEEEAVAGEPQLEGGGVSPM